MASHHSIPDRADIVAVAVTLFGQHGFDRVSAKQISAASGVSRRTFFRYFGSKQDVLFHSHEHWVSRFRELLFAADLTVTDGVDAGAPDVLSPRDTESLAHLGRCLRAVFDRERSEQERAIRAIVMSDPALLARWSQLALDYERAIAERLIACGLDEVRAAVLAGACVGALLAGYRRAHAAGLGAPGPMVDTVLEVLGPIPGLGEA